MSEQQLCPICRKPVGDEHPGADVYHMSCLEAKFKVLREKWANEIQKKEMNECSGIVKRISL
jgi:hypothetical protein